MKAILATAASILLVVAWPSPSCFSFPDHRAKVLRTSSPIRFTRSVGSRQPAPSCSVKHAALLCSRTTTSGDKTSRVLSMPGPRTFRPQYRLRGGGETELAGMRGQRNRRADDSRFLHSRRDRPPHGHHHRPLPLLERVSPIPLPGKQFLRMLFAI